MMDTTNYLTAWFLYTLGAFGACFVFWKLFRPVLNYTILFFLQTILVAVLFTPWYVLPDQQLMAPAFMIAAMDTITEDAEAGIRALIPMVMAMMLGVIVTIVNFIIRKIKARKKRRYASS